MEDEATMAGRSRAGKTNRNRSEWGHSRVFSSDDDEEAAGPASRRAGGAKSVASHKSKGLKVCIPLCMISPSAVGQSFEGLRKSCTIGDVKICKQMCLVSSLKVNQIRFNAPAETLRCFHVLCDVIAS